MALSQIQIIRSLAEALAWFEKEIEWGVPPGELRHLVGRIGELYVAMRTRGQMAPEVNQRGYDVVSAEGERISVKTYTSSQQCRLNKNTFEFVHRVIVLRVKVDDDISIEEILDLPAADFLTLCRDEHGDYVYSLSKHVKRVPLDEQRPARKVSYGPYVLTEFESGTIQIEDNGVAVRVVKPVLRKLASEIGVSLTNDRGNPRNTRQLGSEVIAAIENYGEL